MTWQITVTQLVPDHALTKPDDVLDNPAGTYFYEAGSEDEALDEFHNSVCIACLDDFDVEADEVDASALALIAELEALPGDDREAAWLAIGEMVHDCAECAPAETQEAEMAAAGDVNNGDFPAQVAYLFSHNPPAEIEAEIREAAGLPARVEG